MGVGDRKLIGLIAGIQGILELGELRTAMLDALLEAVPADWISLNDFGPDPADAWFASKPPLPEPMLGLFAELSHENPLVDFWLQTRDGRAYRFTDVADPHELEGRRLFREFYAPLGIRHQIAFTLPSPRDRVLAIALSRRNRNFSDEERDFLNEARPFLIQAYRNAVAYSLAASNGASQEFPGAERLTNREREVIRLIGMGRSASVIAEQLALSPRTVQKHLEHAYRKLGVKNRSEAAALVWPNAEAGHT